MRTSVWLTASVMALALVACSPKQAAAPSPPPPAPASEPAPAPAAASAPTPESPPAGAPTPENAAPTAGPATPAAAAPYRFSPGDFGKQERRIAALIANAETRDTLGETAGIAAQGQRARERCTTRKCVEGAYAAEEARLRKWEGSGDVR
jgi:hypothetical protein